MMKSNMAKQDIHLKEIFRKTVGLYAQNFSTLFAISFLGFLLTILDQIFSLTFYLPPFLKTMLSFFKMYFVFWSQAALIFSLMSLWREATVQIKDSFLQTQQMVITFFFVNIFTGLLITGGTLLLIVPGVFLAVILSLADECLVLHRTGLVGALKMSRELVRGHFGKVFIVMILLNLIFLPVYLISLPLEKKPVVDYILLVLSSALMPLVLGVYVGLYHELYQMKKNVLDLQTFRREASRSEGLFGCLGVFVLVIAVSLLLSFWLRGAAIFLESPVGRPVFQSVARVISTPVDLPEPFALHKPDQFVVLKSSEDPKTYQFVTVHAGSFFQLMMSVLTDRDLGPSVLDSDLTSVALADGLEAWFRSRDPVLEKTLLKMKRHPIKTVMVGGQSFARDRLTLDSGRDAVQTVSLLYTKQDGKILVVLFSGLEDSEAKGFSAYEDMALRLLKRLEIRGQKGSLDAGTVTLR